MTRPEFRKMLPADLTDWPGLMDGTKKSLLHNKMISATTGLINDTPMCIGGLNFATPSVAEGFLILRPTSFLYPCLFIGIRREWARMISTVRRVSMFVDILDPKRIRFAYYLGMSPEGIVHGIGENGGDFIMFSRVKK